MEMEPAARRSIARLSIHVEPHGAASIARHYIKDLVYSGFNLDESKRVVFEGIMPLISGSRLTNTNIEFATPGRVPSPVNSYFYGGDQFPHTYATLTDPITGRTDGWLKAAVSSALVQK